MSLEKISKKLRPDEEEITAAVTMFEKIKSHIQHTYGIESLLVGSVGKGTFISDDKDLDIFILFDPDTPREKLEKEGLKIGKETFESFGAHYDVAYAEHPYVSGIVDGYSVELVPCYHVQSPENIKSAVDRTPFHLSYITNNISEKQKDDVRLLKRFLKAQKLYGADARTQGFSGYLCELMILHYNTFPNLIAHAVTWDKTTVIPLTEGTKKFEDPLTLIDPVDPGRNVASAVRRPTYARFILACRTYELSKSDKMFTLPKRGYMPIEGGNLIVIEMISHVIEDTFYAQSRRFLDHIVNECGRSGFTLYRSGLYRKGILLDVEVGSLPAFEQHRGPPLYSYENARSFEEKYPHVDITEGDRLCTYKPRKYTNITDLLNDIIKEKTGMGNHLKRAKVRIVKGNEAQSLVSSHIVFMR